MPKEPTCTGSVPSSTGECEVLDCSEQGKRVAILQIVDRFEMAKVHVCPSCCSKIVDRNLKFAN